MLRSWKADHRPLAAYQQPDADDWSGKLRSPTPDLVRRLSKVFKRRMVYLSVFGVLFLWLAAVATIKGRVYTDRRARVEVTYPKAPNLEEGDRKFVIVIPTNSPGLDLCKAISSAIALGYPAPVIVNWGKTFDDPEIRFGGSHIAKMYGVLEYLDAASNMNTTHADHLGDDDLVLMVDAHDVWFQLPPEALIRRFHETNQKANGRLAQQWGSFDDMPMKQTIVASAQKRCFPDNDRPAELHCNAVPESTLRQDTYGDWTDDPWDLTLHSMRPKFINSGIIMGPVRDMKRLFRHVVEKAERRKSEGLRVDSDQGLIGEVFGEQSVWRNIQRQAKATRTAISEAATRMMQDNWENHLGLDYEQVLSVSTYYEEFDGQFIPLDDKEAIRKASNKLGISPARLHGVPQDLKSIPNPLVNIYENKFPVDLAWGNQSLYADFYTTAVPAILHHNAKRYGAKERRTTWWDKTWYFPYLRDLVKSQIQPGGVKPLARLLTSAGQLVYWPVSSDGMKRKVREFNTTLTESDSMHEMEFSDVCKDPAETSASAQHWYDEVYRDGKGAL